MYSYTSRLLCLVHIIVFYNLCSVRLTVYPDTVVGSPAAVVVYHTRQCHATTVPTGVLPQVNNILYASISHYLRIHHIHYRELFISDCTVTVRSGNSDYP